MTENLHVAQLPNWLRLQAKQHVEEEHAAKFDAAASEIERLWIENFRLRFVARGCRDQFAAYAAHHAEKGAHEKAALNRRFADTCDNALTR